MTMSKLIMCQSNNYSQIESSGGSDLFIVLIDIDLLI